MLHLWGTEGEPQQQRKQGQGPYATDQAAAPALRLRPAQARKVSEVDLPLALLEKT